MPFLRTICTWARMHRPVSMIAIILGMLAVTAAVADIIKQEDMLHGISIMRAQCTATPQTIWLNVDRQDFCVRYYLSTLGGEGTRPVVFLQGDKFGPVKNWQWAPPSSKDPRGFNYEPLDDPRYPGDVHTEDLMRQADSFSRMAKTPAIYLARIGVDGTSGNHVFRKTLLELHLMNAALDVIKQRHGFEGFHLAGQSGGAALITALAGIRHDVTCAVSGSGPLIMGHDTEAKDPARTLISPPGLIASLAANRELRFFVLTDKDDEMVPSKLQTPFVEKLRRVGRPVTQYFVKASDSYHHGAVEYARLVAAGCALGKSDSEISTAIDTMVKITAAFADMRRKEIAALTKSKTAQRKP